jgi:hypothetical protein
LIRIDELVLSNEKITNSLIKFWDDVVSKLDDKQYILIQGRQAQFFMNVAAGYKSISYVQLVNKNDFKLFI